MSPFTTTAPMADVPCGRRTSTPKQDWPESPSEVTFAAILANPALTAFDKLLLTLLATYCRAFGNAFAFPGSLELAQRLGVHRRTDGCPVKDGGVARVNRSLAKMDRMGILSRVHWYDMDEFMASVGRPRLDIADPRDRSDKADRFLLLWWKVPGLGEGLSVSIRTADRPGAGDQVDRRRQGAGRRTDMTPAPGRDQAPARALRTGSNSELLNGTEDVNVDAAAPRGNTEPEAMPVPVAPPISPPAAPMAVAPPMPPPGDDQVAAWIRQARSSPRAFERTLAVAELVACGRCPDDLAPRGDWSKVASVADGTPPTSAPPPPVARPAASTTVEMLRRLAYPCGPEAVEAAARKLAAELDDLGSINYHRKRLAEVRGGTLPLKVVLSALRSSEGSGVADRRKVYVNCIETGRGRL